MISVVQLQMLNSHMTHKKIQHNTHILVVYQISNVLLVGLHHMEHCSQLVEELNLLLLTMKIQHYTQFMVLLQINSLGLDTLVLEQLPSLESQLMNLEPLNHHLCLRR